MATATVLALAGDAIAQRSTAAPYDRARGGLCFRRRLPRRFHSLSVDHRALPATLFERRRRRRASRASTRRSSRVRVHGAESARRRAGIYYHSSLASPAPSRLTARRSLARRAPTCLADAANWKFWIPAQLAQFAFLGEEWQVPYTCVMGLVPEHHLRRRRRARRRQRRRRPPAGRFVGKVVRRRRSARRGAREARVSHVCTFSISQHLHHTARSTPARFQRYPFHDTPGGGHLLPLAVRPVDPPRHSARCVVGVARRRVGTVASQPPSARRRSSRTRPSARRLSARRSSATSAAVRVGLFGPLAASSSSAVTAETTPSGVVALVAEISRPRRPYDPIMPSAVAAASRASAVALASATSATIGATALERRVRRVRLGDDRELAERARGVRARARRAVERERDERRRAPASATAGAAGVEGEPPQHARRLLARARTAAAQEREQVADAAGYDDGVGVRAVRHQAVQLARRVLRLRRVRAVLERREERVDVGAGGLAGFLGSVFRRAEGGEGDVFGEASGRRRSSVAHATACASLLLLSAVKDATSRCNCLNDDYERWSTPTNCRTTSPSPGERSSTRCSRRSRSTSTSSRCSSRRSSSRSGRPARAVRAARRRRRRRRAGWRA